MTNETDILAKKIADLITHGSASSSLADIRSSIESINERLARLETQPAEFASSTSPARRHPSQDQFAIAEAVVDSLFGQEAKEKACTFEPSKPCDHCSMCNSRGF